MASVRLDRRPVRAPKLPGTLISRPALLALAGTAVLAALARVPYLTVGVGPDEGGYAYVARQWARGLTLYRDVWIDRPQGLLSIYRVIYELSGHLWAFRLGALVVGAGVTLVVGAIAWMLRGPWTGVAAALIYAVVGVGPHIEGLPLNGELAAALPSAGAVACAIAWWKSGRRPWLAAAGALGATAILMKQGGFDGLAAAAALAFALRGPLVERAKALGLVAAGAMVPIGAARIHALTVGFGKYCTDVVSVRARHELGDPTLVGPFGRLKGTFPKDPIYALDSRATLYYLANRVTRYPYIWHHSPLLTPSGMKLLRKMLAGPDRPRIVVLYRNPRELDKSQRLAAILTRYYREVWRPVKGTRVLVRRDAPTITPPPATVQATRPAGRPTS